MYYKLLPFEHEETITKKLQDLYYHLYVDGIHPAARPYDEIKSAVPELTDQFDKVH